MLARAVSRNPFMWHAAHHVCPERWPLLSGRLQLLWQPLGKLLGGCGFDTFQAQCEGASADDSKCTGSPDPGDGVDGGDCVDGSDDLDGGDGSSAAKLAEYYNKRN
ncbi:hypothetical protein QOT17_002817 [Balamuthia mandrillaris]